MDPPAQFRVNLGIDFDNFDYISFKKPICQYCFRALELDRSLFLLASDLRQKPPIQSSTFLDDLWISSTSSSVAESLTSSSSVRQKSDHIRAKSINLSSPRKPLRFSDDEDFVIISSTPPQSTVNKFSTALPSTLNSPMVPPLPPLTYINQYGQQVEYNNSQQALMGRNFVGISRKLIASNVMPPCLSLQPRQPKQKYQIPPVDVTPSLLASNSSSVSVQGSNGSIKRSRTSSQKIDSLKWNREYPSISSSPSHNQLDFNLQSSTQALGGNQLRDSQNGLQTHSSTYLNASQNSALSMSSFNDDYSENSDQMVDITPDEILLAEIFAHTIAEYNLDIPLCRECAPKYIDHLSLEIEDVEDEIEHMEQYLSQFPTEQDFESHFRDYEQQNAIKLQEYEEMSHLLENLLVENQKLDEKIKILEDRETTLSSLKEDYWNRYSRYKNESHHVEEVCGTVLNKLSKSASLLEMLRTSCCLNDAFHISFLGHYATINGLRIGLRSPNKISSVGWDEFSAAFGFLAFLFFKAATAMKHPWVSSKWKIHVDGSFSVMVLKQDRSRWNLFVDGDASFVRFFGQPQFDLGLEAFVECVLEVLSHIMRIDTDFFLPFPITASPLSIGGHQLAKSGQNPENWTHTVKCLAIDIKIILAWLIEKGYVK